MSIAQRRKAVTVLVGGVAVGSDYPVVVQSMTNTDTADAAGTAKQVAELANAGAELVRVTVNNDAAAMAIPEVVSQESAQLTARVLLRHVAVEIQAIDT